MKGIWKLFYLFLIPIVLAFLFEWIFKGLIIERIFNVIENLLFTIILISPLLFITNKGLSRSYVITSFLFFSFCVYFETIYYYLFTTSFSSSSIFVILDSNADEAKEFISFYIDVPIVFITLVFILVCIVVIFLSKKTPLLVFNRKQISILKILGVVFGIFLFLKISTLIVHNLPYLILKSNVEYFIEAKKLEDYKNNKEGSFQDVSRVTNKEDELYVVIIGESTSRSHFGLYNYYRQTTPELNKIKSDLLVYNNIISPHVFSIWSLTKVLTLGNYENPEKTTEGSIIQLINKAGLETYWLSNQRPIGPYESLITKISLSSNRHEFITTTIAGNSKVLDEELIPEFDKAINNGASKKVIFLHLMGTHHHYENRYPEAFNIFKDWPLTNFKSSNNFKKINHYDNAVLYNDFIISEVIKKVNEKNIKSFVLYFSDHGEEVFDNIDMSGHNEDIYSKNMYDIPFILWQSEKFKDSKKIDFVKDRAYMIDDLFYSIADLLEVTAKETDSTRSIFSKNFKERKRIIKDTIDYDSFFKK